MERVLQLVDQRFGGIVNYLQERGLGDSDLERLGRRLAPEGR
jgi:hypothetical protein